MRRCFLHHRSMAAHASKTALNRPLPQTRNVWLSLNRPLFRDGDLSMMKSCFARLENLFRKFEVQLMRDRFAGGIAIPRISPYDRCEPIGAGGFRIARSSGSRIPDTFILPW